MGDGHRGGGYSADEEGLVCPCMGTTKDEIFEAVAAGARNIEDVERATGAGTRCGRCRAAVAAVVEEALAQTA
ncbi:MAG: (2Fe-2S)-binding protein [Atopobiaceae bacterium]|jgi:bacterioferritin-associated ferredoxin|uniref:(2Fe-2S)-binding protein n=1 Tax=Olsenella sp. AGMB03486 TaxID=3230364 RepID=UPI002A87F576|nr:(2Fe-2S)-binding protein [Olsenella sp.]MDY4650770.1 (2Fe-2S)-binding protein [Atopobiaceae bacterium]MDY5004017.1 (2Fe-2S)-binding protein [Atopobiaceae bacterium]